MINSPDVAARTALAVQTARADPAVVLAVQEEEALEDSDSIYTL